MTDNIDYQDMMAKQAVEAGFKDFDEDFFIGGIFNACKDFTMTSIERMYALYKSVQYISESGVPGDLAECGVWKGGSCMMMALSLLKHGNNERAIYLYDTFKGLPIPDPEKDVDIWYRRAIDYWHEEWAYSPIEEVTSNMKSTGYPPDKILTIPGMVEDTLLWNNNIPESLALLRIDTDWASSAQVIMERLYHKVSEGGVLIFDDYGHYKGQKEVIDNFFSERKIKPLLHRVDYSCRVMIKNV